MNLIRPFVRRPVMTSVFVVLMVFVGIYGYMDLGMALSPKVDLPLVLVITSYPGAGPTEVETVLTKPIEDAVAQVEGIKKIESYSQEGSSVVLIWLEYDVDTAGATLAVSNRVRAIQNTLPEDAYDPIIEKYDINAEPFLTLVVTSHLPPEQAYDLVEEKIQRRLTQIQGLARAEIRGGVKREVQVYLDPARMIHFGLSVGTVMGAIAANTENDPSGHVARGSKETSLRVLGQFQTPQGLGEIRLPLGQGASVRLGEVARIVDGTEEARSLARYDGKTAIMVECSNAANANVVNLGKEIHRLLDKIRPDLPPGMDVLVADDESTFIKSAVENVFSNMFQGIIYTALTLFLFFQRMSIMTLVALTMPTAIMGTFVFMKWSSMTMNMMSTLGLAISVGMLVNNAILVLENIFRFRHLGHDPLVAAEEGTGEIWLAVLATTATNLGVFIPVAFMGGIAGQFLKDFALTVVFSTVLSLWVSLTLVPTLAARIGDRPPSRLSRGLTDWWLWLYQGIEDLHHILVTRAVRHPWGTLLIFALLFGGAGALVPRMGMEFVPKADRGVVTIGLELPTDASLAQTDAMTRRVEAHVRTLPHVEHVDATVGRRGVNQGRVRVYLQDVEGRPSTFEVADRLRPFLAGLPDVTATVAGAAHGGGGPGRPIEINITGDDLGKINAIASQVLDIVRATPGAVDADTSWKLGRPELQFSPKRWKLGQVGLSVEQIATTVRAFVAGKRAGVFRSDGKEYDIVVRMEPKNVESIFQIPDLPVAVAGGFLPLRELADFSFGAGPTEIQRKDRQRSVAVEANVAGRSVGDVFGDIQKRLGEVKLPPGYRLMVGGEVEDMQENFRYLYIALGMAVGLTFLITAAIIESYLFSLIIMLTVPLSAIGVVPLMVAMNTAMSIYGLLGVVMLVGVVVNNAIVVIDYAEHLRRHEGWNPREGIVEACKVRLRPIIMADATSIVAMIPLALGMGEGGVYRAPMAIVVIGGLFAGGTLALFAIPPVYDRVWAGRQWFSRRRRKKGAVPVASE